MTSDLKTGTFPPNQPRPTGGIPQSFNHFIKAELLKFRFLNKEEGHEIRYGEDGQGPAAHLRQYTWIDSSKFSAQKTRQEETTYMKPGWISPGLDIGQMLKDRLIKTDLTWLLPWKWRGRVRGGCVRIGERSDRSRLETTVISCSRAPKSVLDKQFGTSRDWKQVLKRIVSLVIIAMICFSCPSESHHMASVTVDFLHVFSGLTCPENTNSEKGKVNLILRVNVAVRRRLREYSVSSSRRGDLLGPWETSPVHVALSQTAMFSPLLTTTFIIPLGTSLQRTQGHLAHNSPRHARNWQAVFLGMGSSWEGNYKVSAFLASLQFWGSWPVEKRGSQTVPGSFRKYEFLSY
ncbi:hypothetical protein Bbelb_293400 [Branchiostoma belcheri]|nr:hypothetical protein Bbelb_293400 [Branchiostoma belcheri]